MYVSTWPPTRRPQNDPTGAFVGIDVGDRYTICIGVDTPDWEEIKERQWRHVYDDSGKLVIEDICAEPAKKVEGRPGSFRELFDEIFWGGRIPRTAQLACFGTEDEVPATPENMAQAIQWCLANPNFLTDHQQGI